MSMPSDAVDYGFKMAATEPELEITLKTVGDFDAIPNLSTNFPPWLTLA